ncbi:hypothetical protein H4Q26_010479 [Puccinia striiformis f. sp. tritici PST-130]|nr:hypothetical protein H4Q26_010479 [Puccinia striiformis f. sp. tritici PST-130]
MFTISSVFLTPFLSLFPPSDRSAASITMYSAVCPIGDPARDLSRARRPAQKVVSQRRPTLASSQFSRPKGTVFSVNNLPLEIKNLQPSQRNGVVFNVDDLPQEFR